MIECERATSVPDYLGNYSCKVFNVVNLWFFISARIMLISQGKGNNSCKSAL